MPMGAGPSSRHTCPMNLEPLGRGRVDQTGDFDLILGGCELRRRIPAMEIPLVCPDAPDR